MIDRDLTRTGMIRPCFSRARRADARFGYFPATKWWLIFRVGATPSARSEISAAQRTMAGSESLVFGVQSGRHRSAKSQRFCPPWRPATISCPVRQRKKSIMPTFRSLFHPVVRQPTLEGSSKARDGNGPSFRIWLRILRRSRSLDFIHASARAEYVQLPAA